jgi:hypothetical protein
MSAITSKTAWNAYASAIMEQVFGNNFDPDESTFSLAGQTLNVDLANADPAISNASVFGIGNTIPAPGGAYVAGSSLISSYFSFLNWIKLQNDPNPNLQSQINIAAGNLSSNQTNYQTVFSNALTAWNNYKTALGSNISFLDYCTTQYPTYMEAKSSLDAAQSQYSQLMLQAYGPDYQTIVNAQNITGYNGAQSTVGQSTYNMAVKFGSAAPAGSGPAVLPGQNPAPPASSLISTFCPGFTVNSAFLADYQRWQTQSVQQPAKMTGLKIHLDASTTTSDWESMGWSAQLSASFPIMDFVSVQFSGQASYASQTFNYASSGFSFDVEYLGSGLYPIGSNLWFDPSLCKNYGSSLRAGAPDFFSEAGGSLSRYPSQVLIGFQPKISMSLSASDYSSFKSQFQQSSTVAIKVGPFTVGSVSESSYSQKQNVEFNDSNNSFTIGPVQTMIPNIIGVVCSKVKPGQGN